MSSLAEMLRVFMLVLSVIHKEAVFFGLHISWSKIKIFHVYTTI